MPLLLGILAGLLGILAGLCVLARLLGILVGLNNRWLIIHLRLLIRSANGGVVGLARRDIRVFRGHQHGERCRLVYCI